MTKVDPVFRAPKGTANFNAYRTLAMGVFGAIIVMLLTDPVMRLWDRAVQEVPWISSEMYIAPAVAPYGAIVSDSTIARLPVSGTRSVWMEDATGMRICSTQRTNSWRGRVGNTWTIKAFTGGCHLPDQPFRICSRFIVETPRGVPGSFGPFCSELYHQETGNAPN